MNLGVIGILAIIQGITELLPVSSSAHVILAERLLGLDPSSPEMIFLLVMLHSGTMAAVIFYFWPKWKALFKNSNDRKLLFTKVTLATILTTVTGLILKWLIEQYVLHGENIEALFRNLKLISASLFVAGIIIVISGVRLAKKLQNSSLSYRLVSVVGFAQGFCLPFRGLSRSGTTISLLLLGDIDAERAEEFSFLLAVILTPAILARGVYRLMGDSGGFSIQKINLFAPGIFGFVISFISGLLAMAWLSRWLENQKWIYFGVYCLILSVGMFAATYFDFIS